MGVIIANGKAYDGADMVINLLGNQPVNFKSFKYSKTREGQTGNGQGGKIVNHSIGKESCEATIELGMDVMVAIRTAYKGKSVIDGAPFNVVVTYEQDNNVLTSDVVTIKFLEDKGGAGVDDMNLMVDPKLLCLDVVFNVPVV